MTLLVVTSHDITYTFCKKNHDFLGSYFFGVLVLQLRLGEHLLPDCIRAPIFGNVHTKALRRVVVPMSRWWSFSAGDPTHKIPPEFVRGPLRSYQRYLEDVCYVCFVSCLRFVSVRSWKFHPFFGFEFVWEQNYDANGTTHQGPHAKVLLFRAETDSGKSSSSSFERPAAGRLWTCCEMPKCHMWVLIIWVNLPKAFAKVQLRVQTLSWRKSAFKKRAYGSNQTFVDIHRWTSTNTLITSSLENPRSKKLLKSRPRTETKTSTRLFTENVHPTLPKWLKIRKLQREAASEKSGSQWISGESLYDFFAAGRQPWCQKSAPLLSNKTTGSRSLREATYYPFSTVFTEIPGSKGSAILTLQRFVKLFFTIQPQHHATAMCSLRLRSSGRDSGREKYVFMPQAVHGFAKSSGKLCRMIQVAQNGNQMESHFFSIAHPR